ncbi:MFS transporter [Brevibacterium sp. 50QC2O2]|uniref:MFS transporter n=1 Tax=Brevibacterium sp. 50QC2O2 TaxID=2968459 RepID=UPI00211B84D6|nr:MFS transporter [Brevibacterium sp. 50QC2O2]MCQ9389633.1 MFS transporter [Brevibacterium sp. 50QC2O2]
MTAEAAKPGTTPRQTTPGEPVNSGTDAQTGTGAPRAKAPAGPGVKTSSWLAVAATMFAVAWGGNEFTPLLVMYRNSGEFSPVAVDGMLAAYVFGIVPAMLIGGPLSDRHGRRPLLLPAAPAALIGSLIIALTPDSEIGMIIGRIFCGIALGLVMAIGSTWIKELSDAAGAGAAAGAKRASMSLTLGFLAGAGVAAMLAQFAPLPQHLPYILHMVITVVTGLWLLSVPETRRAGVAGAAAGNVGAQGGAACADAPARKSLWQDLKVPKMKHKRFLLVVLPAAPWVFGTAASAYAVLPGLLSDSAGNYPIAFAGLITVVTLGFGVGIQSLGPVIDTRRSARATVIGMCCVAAGLALAIPAAATLSLALGLVAAVVLGMGYGLTLVAGLSEVQRIAGPDDLAGLNAVFYALTYMGFFVPMVLAWAHTWLGYPQMFFGGLVLAVICLVIVACAWRRHLPGARIPADAKFLQDGGATGAGAQGEASVSEAPNPTVGEAGAA